MTLNENLFGRLINVALNHQRPVPKCRGERRARAKGERMATSKKQERAFEKKLEKAGIPLACPPVPDLSKVDWDAEYRAYLVSRGDRNAK
jgi:hypothetical protein